MISVSFWLFVFSAWLPDMLKINKCVREWKYLLLLIWDFVMVERRNFIAGTKMTVPAQIFWSNSGIQPCWKCSNCGWAAFNATRTDSCALLRMFGNGVQLSTATHRTSSSGCLNTR